MSTSLGSVTKVTAVVCTLVLAGCGAGNLQFKNDHRLSFAAPAEREHVEAPLTIRWSMRDFTTVGLDGSATKDRGVFAVFVDRPPMPAGKNLKWLTRSDKGCERDPRCPDLQYLSDRGVHVTTKTALTLDVLPQLADAAGDEQHYINIVLLDGTGRRIGESGWYRPFTSERR